MSISGASSYVPTTRQFITHWEDANAALPLGSPLLLPLGTGGFTLPVTQLDLVALLEEEPSGLIPLRTGVEASRNALETSSSQLLIEKTALLARLVEFNAYVRTWYEDTKWISSLADAPRISTNESNFMKPMDDADVQWNTMQAELLTAIELLGGYTQLQFQTDISNLRASYKAWTNASQSLKMAIQSRVATQNRIYAVLKKYREVVQGRFAKDSPVVLTLPRLTPLPGHTPEAVILTAAWNDAESKAELGWTASLEDTLEHYEIRYCTGPVYDTDVEEHVATVPKTGPLTFLTAAGLSLPGAIVSYKVYVVLETDNEKGSVAVVVSRPA